MLVTFEFDNNKIGVAVDREQVDSSFTFLPFAKFFTDQVEVVVNYLYLVPEKSL